MKEVQYGTLPEISEKNIPVSFNRGYDVEETLNELKDHIYIWK